MLDTDDMTPLTRGTVFIGRVHPLFILALQIDEFEDWQKSQSTPDPAVVERAAKLANVRP
jgi:hypothetical protein